MHKILCKACHHTGNSLYDLLNGGLYIPKFSFIDPKRADIYLSHPTHIHILREVVKYLKGKERPPAGILDVGCGYGRAVNYFSKNFACRIYGIEIIDYLAVRAVLYNRRQSNAEIIHGDATTFSLPRDCDVVFLFNPFPYKYYLRFIEHNRDARAFKVILLNHTYHDEIIQRSSGIKYDFLDINHCGRKIKCACYYYDGDLPEKIC